MIRIALVLLFFGWWGWWSFRSTNTYVIVTGNNIEEVDWYTYSGDRCGYIYYVDGAWKGVIEYRWPTWDKYLMTRDAAVKWIEEACHSAY